MGEIVQVAGGAADIESEYTGPERELRVDTDNNDLLIHDGSTPGGHRVPNRDNNDERYQARSSELDGIGPFTPEQRGILVRRAPGEYRLRKLTVSTAFTLENGDGYGGDLNLVLSGEIEQDIRFKQDVIVDGVLQVTGGINSDTSGTHYGTVVGNLTGNGTGNFTGTFAGALVGKHTGDLDARNKVVQFSDGAIPTSAIADLLTYIKTNGCPIGAIMLWSGIAASIPAGWHLCDGTAGTPDLRDKFIIGAGETYAVGNSGGAASASGSTGAAGAHAHAGSTVNGHTLTIAELPSHAHALTSPVPQSGSGFGYSGSAGVTGSTVTTTVAVGGDDAHDHGLTVTAEADHTHTMTVATLPPYYALCYIMHVG